MDDEAVLPADGLYVVSGWVVCYTLIEEEKYEPFFIFPQKLIFWEKRVTDYHKIRVYIQRDVERRKRP